jgi:prophage tail gpP-like protein
LIAIEGRDRAGDLVDCSAIYKGGQWRDASLTQIASDLAAPFGIPVIAATDVGDSFPSFAIQDGETVFEAIARAAALRGVLAISDKEGGIVLARAGQSRHAFGLQRPGNMLGGEADYSDDERFSDYIVKGQRRGTDDDEGAPEGPSSPVGQAQDSGVKRYRPLIIMAEDQVDGVDATRRAEWERNVRAGRSDRINVRVRGWREQGDKGDLWEPNRVVHINDTEWLWINADLLIADVNYLRGRMGTITEIGLMPALAFDLLQGQPTP